MPNAALERPVKTRSDLTPALDASSTGDDLFSGIRICENKSTPVQRCLLRSLRMGSMTDSFSAKGDDRYHR